MFPKCIREITFGFAVTVDFIYINQNKKENITCQACLLEMMHFLPPFICRIPYVYLVLLQVLFKWTFL